MRYLCCTFLFCCLVGTSSIEQETIGADDNLALLQKQAAMLTHEHSASPEDFCTEDKLVLNDPVENDISGNGIRYPNVKDGVDLVLTAGEGYQVHREKFNGLYMGFGSVNMMSGASTDLTFKFVQTGTDNPVQMPKVSITWYDLDEGQDGRSRARLETCGAARSFVPATTELSQVTGGNGCFATSTCKFGRKGNGPKSPDEINADHYSRTLTYSYAAKSEFKVRLASAAGFNGRNYRFTLDPINACKMTTTSTTQGPQPVCTMPTGPYTICSMRQDPYADRVFAGAAGWVREIGLYRVARSVDKSIEVQAFHCPFQKNPGQIAIICGVAVKMGDTIVEYMPSRPNRLNAPKLYVNGVEKEITFAEKNGDASILPAPLGQNPQLLPFSQETDVVCVHDNNAKAAITIGERAGRNVALGGPNFFELDWKMFMTDAAIDKTGNTCGMGVTALAQTRLEYHDLENSLFSAKSTNFLCENFMGAPKCGNWADNLAHDVESNQDLCEEMGTDYDEAFNACQGFANKRVENACIFEFCQDNGKGNPRQGAQEGEDNLEEGDLEVANIHDRDFTPDECCDDDPDCDKNIKLAQ